MKWLDCTILGGALRALGFLFLAVGSSLLIGCGAGFVESQSTVQKTLRNGLGSVPVDKLNCGIPETNEYSGKVRFKTITEYAKFIETAFALQVQVLPRSEIPFRGSDNFSYEASLQFTREIDEENFKLILKIAENAAKLLIEKKSHIFSCPPKSIDCLVQFLTQVATEHGVSLNESSMGALRNIYLSHSDSVEGAKTLLRAFMMSPEALSANHATSEQQFLAEKLAASIWGETPDKELRDAVKRGLLADEEYLKTQIDRLLRDPKSQYFSDSFLRSWLGLRDLPIDEAENAGLPADYYNETQELFRHLLREDGNLMDLLSADYTFVNSKLAAFYGISGTFPEKEYVKVALPAGIGRKGVLGHVSVLTANAGSTIETHPVNRGLYILNQISCIQAPPPPENITSEIDEETILKDLTPREKIEKHSSNPACAACHKIFDPMGFALEGFDSFGKFRTKYPSGKPINSVTTMLTGEPVSNLPEMIDVVQKSGRFQICLTEHLIEYFANRPLVKEDRCAAKKVSGQVFAKSGRFSDLIFHLTTTPQFRMETVKPR